MAEKTISIKINVDDKSLNQLEGDLKGINNQIQELETTSTKLSFDQKFEAAEGALKLFTGAVSSAVGAIGLLGIESKVFDEYERYALATINFTRGLVDMADGFNKLRKSTVLANVAIAANTLLTTVATAVTKGLGFAVNTTTLSFKALKVAIASTGIGLLIVGVGFLIEKLMSASSETDKLTEAQENNIKSINKSAKLREKVNTATNAQRGMEIADLELIGGKEKEIAEIRRKAHEDQKDFLQEQIEAQSEIAQLQLTPGDYVYSKEQRDEALDSRRSLLVELSQLQADFYVKGIQEEIAGNKESQRIAEEAADKEIERLKELQEERLKTIQDITQAEVSSVEQVRELEFDTLDEYYTELINRAKKHGLDTISLENARLTNLKTLKTAFTVEDLQKQRAYEEELQAIQVSSNDFLIQLYETQTLFVQENSNVRRNLIQLNYEFEIDLLDQRETSELAIINERLLLEQITQDQHDTLMLQKREEYQLARLALDTYTNNESARVNQDADDAILNSKLNLFNSLAVGFGNLSLLLKENSKEAKAAALIQIAINTALGFVQGLDIAQKSAAGTGPAAAFAFPIFYAAQIAAVLGAAAQAKRVISSGKSTSSSSTPSTSSPSSGRNNLPADAPITPVVQPTVRTYVLTGDVTSAQEAEAKLNARRNVG
jgi:ribosomal protein S13